jgi:hypothetical protein
MEKLSESIAEMLFGERFLFSIGENGVYVVLAISWVIIEFEWFEGRRT